MFKKILALFLAFSLVVTSGYAAPDMKKGHWAYDSVTRMSNAGYIKPDSNGMYNPNRIVNKFEAVDILSKAYGYTEPKGDVALVKYNKLLNLYDNAFNLWESNYNKKIAYLMNEGIIEDIDLGQFVIKTQEGNEVVRSLKKEQLSAYIARMMLNGSSPSYGYVEKFRDEDKINDRYEKEIYYLKSKGILSGDSNNYFNPTSAVSKAVFATVLDRYVNGVKKEEPKTETPNTSVPSTGSGYTEATFSKIYNDKIMKVKNTKGEFELKVLDPNVKVYVSGSLRTIKDLKENTKIYFSEKSGKVTEVKTTLTVEKTPVDTGDKTETPVVSDSAVVEGSITKIVIGTPSYITINVSGKQSQYKVSSRVSLSEVYALRLNQKIKPEIQYGAIAKINGTTTTVVTKPEDEDDKEDDNKTSEDISYGELSKVYDEDAIRITLKNGREEKHYVDDDTKIYDEKGKLVRDYKDLVLESDLEVKYDYNSSSYKRTAKEIKVKKVNLLKMKGEIYKVYTSSESIKIENDDDDETYKFDIDKESKLYDWVGDEISDYKKLSKDSEVEVFYKEEGDDLVIRELKVLKISGEELEGKIYKVYSSDYIKVRDDDNDLVRVYVNNDTKIYDDDGDEISDYKKLTKDSEVTIIYEEDEDDDDKFVAKQIKVDNSSSDKVTGEIYKIYSSDYFKIKDDDKDIIRIYVEDDTLIYDEDGDKISKYTKLKEDSEVTVTYRLDDDKYYAQKVEVLEGDKDTVEGEMYTVGSSYIRVRDDDDDTYKIYIDEDDTDMYDEDDDKIDDMDDLEKYEDSEVEVEYEEDDDDDDKLIATKITITKTSAKTVEGEMYTVGSSYVRVRDDDDDTFKLYVDDDSKLYDDDDDRVDDLDDLEKFEEEKVEVEYKEDDGKYYIIKLEVK
ncbi:MAG: S-layer homology domain-containing protein [Clostridia bacterium]|jgi:hypothetical protein|nr:S-layer homology domain-containing protein [Clostridia bacterium]